MIAAIGPTEAYSYIVRYMGNVFVYGVVRICSPSSNYEEIESHESSKISPTFLQASELREKAGVCLRFLSVGH